MKYEKCKVVILTAKEKSAIGDFIINYHPHDKSLHCGIKTNEAFNMECIDKHLYIISNDNIKKDDMCYEAQENIIFKAISNFTFLSNGTYRKIIASTDPTLNLPKPSKEFIEKYCKVGGIDDIMVEYETGDMCQSRHNCCDCIDCKLYADTTNVCAFQRERAFPLSQNCLPKVSFDNTICIKKVKDGYTKEEVTELCRKAYRNGYNSGYVDGALGESKYATYAEGDWISANL